MTAPRVGEAERLRRWRMVLGGADDGTGAELDRADTRLDAALAAVYDTAPRRGGSRRGGMAASAPAVARWLGDIRRAFPASVVQVVQRDAIERLGLQQLLLEPEMLAAVEPDVHLVATILELNRLLPDTARATARQVVGQVATDLQRRLDGRTRQAVQGALHRADRTRRPRPGDVDLDRTIRANLRHYVPERRTVVPEHLVGYGRRQRALARDLIVAVDQSGSMADSVVYAGVFSSVLASLRTLRTSVVAFDTQVTDLTAHLHDPVDLLFGFQLGGGTDLGRAVAACAGLVTRPADTVLVLISDLFEGGAPGVALAQVAELVRSGVTVVALLALSDEGAPAYDHQMAAALAGLGVAAFACTPDAFPDLLAAVLERRDVARWAADHGLVTAAAVR